MSKVQRTLPSRSSKLYISSTAGDAGSPEMKPKILDSLNSTTVALKTLFGLAKPPPESDSQQETPKHKTTIGAKKEKLTPETLNSGSNSALNRSRSRDAPMLVRTNTMPSKPSTVTQQRNKGPLVGATTPLKDFSKLSVDLLAPSAKISNMSLKDEDGNVKGSYSSLYSTIQTGNQIEVLRKTSPSPFQASKISSSHSIELSTAEISSTVSDRHHFTDSGFEEENLEVPIDWKPETVKDFSLYKMIGKGAFSKVYLAKRRTDGKIFAIKSMKKENIVKMRQVEHVHNERCLMQQADSPFLAKLHWTLQDPVHLFMIMEFLGGGDMFNHIKNNGRIPTDAARIYAAEIYLGLSALHDHGIVYRDLKPENILLDFEGHVKLADFGFAKQIPGTTRTFCGTPSYIAPEVILRKDYGTQIDWWAFGILIFEMISGCSPFQDENSKKTYDRIVSGRIRWPPNPSKYFSEDAEDIISSLLNLNPSKRLGFEDESDIQKHPFFRCLDWDALYNRALPPPLPVRASIRVRSESVGARSGDNLRGSGDLCVRTGNRDLERRYGSQDGYVLDEFNEPEITLSSEVLNAERSWGGEKRPNPHGSLTSLFVGF